MDLVDDDSSTCRFCFKNRKPHMFLKEMANLLDFDLCQLMLIFGLTHNFYDLLPKSVCEACFQDIKHSIEFRNNAQKAEREMIEHYGNQNTQNITIFQNCGEVNAFFMSLHDLRFSKLLIFFQSVQPNPDMVYKFELEIEDQQITENPKQIETTAVEEKKDMERPMWNRRKQPSEIQVASENEESEEEFSDNEMLSTNKSFILRKYKCRVCNKKFGGTKSYNQHECQLDEMKCRFCQKEFGSSKGNFFATFHLSFFKNLL